MFRCPKCKSTNLEVTVQIWAVLIQPEDDPENFSTDPDAAMDHDHEWDSNSPMKCQDCGHFDIAGEFNEKDHDDEKPEEPAETKRCPDCDTPNQFGELCHKCTLDRQEQFEATHTPG